MADAQQLAQAMAAAIQQALQQQGQDQQQALQQIVQQLQPQQQQAIFARAPALTNNGLIDYSTREGSAIFSKATAPLTNTFSLQQPNVSVLLAELQDRANTYGWSDILTVNNVDILSGHGRVTLEQCQQHASTYINANGRNAQNDYQLLLCLKESVDEDTMTKMSRDTSYYTRPGPNDVDPTTQSGICYLKYMLDKALADTRTVSANIRNSLANLPTLIAEDEEQNIIVFNDKVRQLLKDLEMRGETSSDTLFNVFRAYETCQDKTFTNYISRQKDQYEEGTLNLTTEELMQKAEQKYKNLTLEKKWNKPSQEQEEIIALRAKIELFQRKRTPKGSPKKEDDTTKKGKGRSIKKDANGKPVFEGDQSWRNTPPKANESNTKTVNGKEWKYCSIHGYWCSHTADECRDKDKHQGNQEEQQITAAMAAFGIEETNDSDEESQP